MIEIILKYIKNILKTYFLKMYVGFHFWKGHKSLYNHTKQIVIGHIGGGIGIFYVAILIILNKKNIIQWGTIKEQYHLPILILVGILFLLLIARPLEKYIDNNITTEELKKILTKSNFNKKNTFKYFIWSILFPLLTIIFLIFFNEFMKIFVV